MPFWWLAQEVGWYEPSFKAGAPVHVLFRFGN
jgi:hypothetical protein